jgi:hypothetical protein
VNYQFTIPSALETKQYIPEKLTQLSSTLPDTKNSIPTVDRVLEKISQGQSTQITPLEWVYCIHAKADWDEQHLDGCQETSASIWKVAINNSWLQQRLIWNLAIYYSDKNKQVLAKSLAESFDTFANDAKNVELLTVRIIQAIRSSNSCQTLAIIACNSNLNRTVLINTIRKEVPVWLSVFSEFVDYIAPHFTNIDHPTQQQINWLLRCLDEMSVEQKIKSVNYLLENISKNIASNYPQLVDWFRTHYRNGEAWYLLSSLAKQRLREWIGSINYGDFQKLVQAILPTLSDSDRPGQLKARRDFWSNYSDRFERLRILLPQTSLNPIRHELQGDIHFLENDGSDRTEVCIFDFGEWLVVEFFRGRGSETRLLENNLRNQQILFGDSPLSVKKIRCLGGDKHDHVYLWQEYCPKWLEYRGIIPNTGIISNKKLKPEKLRSREEQIKHWNREIFKLEQEAKDYCNRIGFCMT